MGTWAHHWLYQDFWVLVWPNAGAMPLCAVLGTVGAYCFRRPLRRVWARIRGSLHDPLTVELEALRRHVSNELDAHRRQLKVTLSDHHAAIGDLLDAHTEALAAKVTAAKPRGM